MIRFHLYLCFYQFLLFSTDPPVVGLSLGSNLEASDIKEGDDVYFECNITSNPTASKVTWKKDVRFFLFQYAKTKLEKLSYNMFSRNQHN